MIKVSVIVPIYNVGRFLPQCLDSLCAQSLKDIEIICINDGSTDDSLDILNEYAAKDSRIIVINQANSGQSAARNKGLEAAQGEFIGFVDSDDWIDSAYYEKLYQAAKAFQADIACCGSTYIGKTKNKSMLTYKNHQTAEDLTAKFKLFDIPRYNYIWNKIYHRDLFKSKESRFREGIVYEDMIWMPQMALKCTKAVSVPEVNYFYRYNENSTVNTTKLDPKKEQDYKQARQFQNDFIMSNKIKVEIPYDKKTKYQIFGIPILKIKENPLLKKYYLFGLKFMQTTTVTKA